jgi:PEP-CTERM motif
MNPFPMRRLQQAVLAAGLLASAMAQAVTMTTTTEFGLPLVGGASLSSSGSLALFDPALGNLTGASLTLFASGSAAVDIHNRPHVFSGPAETGGSMRVDLYVDWSSGFSPMQSAVFVSGSDGFLSLEGTWSAAPGTTTTNALQGSNSKTFNLASILTSLSGTGSFLVMSEMTPPFDGRVGVANGGQQFSALKNAAYATGARLTYTYTPASAPVPEPGAWALMLLGLAAVGSGVRARSRR